MSTETKLHLEIFASEYHMLKFFGQYLPKLDVDTSARLSPFLYIYDGEYKIARNLYEFLMQMDELTALDIDVCSSVQQLGSFLVFFNGKPKSPARFVSDSTPDPLVEIKKEDIPIQTGFVDKKPEEAGTDGAAMNDPSDKSKEDILKEAATLKDDTAKVAAKANLERFALEHGVSLSKGKTFDAMMQDFEAAL